MEGPLLTFVLSFFGLVFAHQAQAELIAPSVNTSQEVVQLGPDVMSALKRWNSQFKIYKVDDYAEPVIDLFAESTDELPMAVTGNFNSDDVTDVVVMGASQGHEVIVLVVSDLAKRNYEVIEVSKVVKSNPRLQRNRSDRQGYSGLLTYLSKIPAARLRAAFEAAGHRQSVEWHDGFIVEFFRSAATTSYYFNGQTVKSFRGDYPKGTELRP